MTAAHSRITGPLAAAGLAGLGGLAFAVVAQLAPVSATATAAADSSGTYTVKNAGSGYCLDLPGTSTAAGVQLDQASCTGAARQTWTLATASSGYTLKNAATGLCAGIAAASTSAGKAVEQESCTGAASQEWTLTASGSSYRLVNVNSGKCLNTSGSATSAGALIVQNSCDGVATKQWTLTSGTGTTPPTSPPPTSPPPTGGTPDNTLVGFAAISGNGHGATTGGSGGPTVTVSSLADLQTQAGSSTTETIKVNGVFTGSADVTVASNKTIIGVGSNSGLVGAGLKLKGVYNVIVRNLKISKVLAGNGNGDAIHIESSDHIWIDHNDLSSDLSHDKDYYDGLLDITHAADYITASWNVFHDHWKVSLVGHSDSNASEDTGHLRVTYHHNYFHDVNSRLPSLRFGTGHAFNNYFVNASSGIHSRMGAQFLVQNNVFSNVTTPLTTTGDSDQDGYANASGNDYGGGTVEITQNGGFTTPPYSYSLDSTSSVAATVTANAGTGKVG
jgi:pectate lyase